MNYTRLRTLRVIIPGIIIFVAINLLSGSTDIVTLISEKMEIEDIPGYGIGLVLSVILGVVYHIFDSRRLVFMNYIPLVRQNIRNRMMDIIGLERTYENLEKLADTKGFMNVFYSFLDEDKTLISRAESVRFNGVILSSLSDIVVVFFFSGVILSVKLFFAFDSNTISTIVLFWTISLLCLLVLPIVVKRHIDLSNSQLDYIKQKYSKEVEKRINEILQ